MSYATSTDPSNPSLPIPALVERLVHTASPAKSAPGTRLAPRLDAPGRARAVEKPRLALVCLIPDLVHGHGIVQMPVDHHVADRRNVLEVLGRIRVQQDQVRKLALLDAPDVFVQAQVRGPVDRGGPQALQVCHASLAEHP